MWQLKPLGFFATGRQIAARETPLGLYKGLGAVISGIVPKMAIRFASFECTACLGLPDILVDTAQPTRDG